MEDADAIAQPLDVVEQVAREEERHAALAGLLADELAHLVHARGVEAVHRLVEDDQVGAADQRLREAEPLLHAERVAADAPVLRVRQVHPLEKSPDVLFPGTRERREDAQVLLPRQPRIKGGHLDEGPKPLRGIEPVLAQVHAVEEHRPLGRADEPRHDADRRRLPRAVGAQEPVDCPSIDGQVEALERLDGAVSLRQSTDFEDGFGHGAGC